MGGLYKYKSCPDSFMVFICGTTCVSMQQYELVMRNAEFKGSAVLQIWLTSSRAKNKHLNLFLLQKEPANPPPGLTFNLLEISRAQLSPGFQKTARHPCLSSSTHLPLSSSPSLSLPSLSNIYSWWQIRLFQLRTSQCQLPQTFAHNKVEDAFQAGKIVLFGTHPNPLLIGGWAAEKQDTSVLAGGTRSDSSPQKLQSFWIKNCWHKHIYPFQPRSTC